MAGSHERTFIMAKPDAVHRGLVGEIIQRFERRGYKLVAMKFMHASKDLLAKHYAEHKGKPFYPKLLDYIGSGPVVPMVWEGTNAVKVGRDMLGATDPGKSAMGTIRGDFCLEMGRNACHGSDSVPTAQREIALWFSDKELVDWHPVQHDWVIEPKAES